MIRSKIVRSPTIQFTIHTFGVHGALKCEGALFATSNEDGITCLPFITFSVGFSFFQLCTKD